MAGKQKKTTTPIDNKRITFRTFSRTKASRIILFAPILLIVIVIPLIVREITFQAGLSGYDWFSSVDTYTDYFLYAKHVFFVAMLALMAVLLFCYSFVDKLQLRFPAALLPLALFVLFTFFSSCFGGYANLSFRGLFEQFESFWAFAGYGFCVYYIYVCVQSKDDLQLLFDATGVGALLVGGIGAFQAFGLDVFQTKLGSLLITGDANADIVINFEAGRTYTTLYNPNYVGVYSVTMLAVFLVSMLFVKQIGRRLFYLAIVIVNVTSLFGSGSKAGFLSLIVTIVFLCVVTGKYLLSRWYLFIPALTLLVCVFFTVDNYKDGAYSNAIYNALQLNRQETPALSDISLSEEGISITYNNETMHLQYGIQPTEIAIALADDAGQPILYEFKEDYSGFLITDERFPFSIQFISLATGDEEKEYYGIAVIIDGVSWSFCNALGDNQYYYYNRFGKFTTIEASNTMLFDGYENFASGRGFIWAHTLPVLCRHIILGTGANSFIAAFPQHSYVALQNSKFSADVISRPHCMYLQVGVQSGLVGLICLLIFFGMILVKGIRFFYRYGFKSEYGVILAASLCGCFAYLFCSISNDSFIMTSAPMFCITGIAFTVLYRLGETEQAPMKAGAWIKSIFHKN